MMNIIDIEDVKKAKRKERRDKRKKDNAPDSNCQTIGRDGKVYYRFSVRYAFKRKNWEFEIWAVSKKEAYKRVAAIQNFPVEITQTHSSIVI